jgi:hypothetical protein
MDPISIVGVASASVQIAQFIAQTIQGLCTLRGKFKDANTTIRLLIGELSTIRAAVSQLRDWAEWNANDSPKEEEYLKGLAVALDGCQAAMEVLAEEIKDLVNGIVTTNDPASFNLGFIGRAKVVWSEDIMKTHQDRLRAQVQALQLLLQASHWYVNSSFHRLGILLTRYYMKPLFHSAAGTASPEGESPHYPESCR